MMILRMKKKYNIILRRKDVVKNIASIHTY